MKNRFYWPRDESFSWNYKEQPVEIRAVHKIKRGKIECLRIHPLMHWKEIEVWRYIEREGIPVVPLYFAKDGKRYSSIGCRSCCIPIDSNASTVSEIIEELMRTRLSPDAGSLREKETATIIQKLRALGYM